MNDPEFIEIDGSIGEGGGQILRTAITFSSILNIPVKVENIRSNRPNPGLKAQHMGTVKLLADMCGANVENLEIGAKWLKFNPTGTFQSSLKLEIGTAGSIPLILSAIVPAASLNGVGCDLEIIGGTDVKWSPTIDYFQFVVLPAFRSIGIHCSLDIIRRGYYPNGGGIIRLYVKPSTKLMPMYMVSKKSSPISALSVCSNLPRNIAERQLRSALNYLSAQNVSCNESVIDIANAVSPGSSIILYSVSRERSFVGADMIGERSKSAENVGIQVAKLFLKEYLSEAPIDMHLGDILVIPLFQADGESNFRVSTITPHLRTNLHVASLMTGRKYSFDSNKDGTTTVTIKSHDID
ncbi:RNA 3'-terminal phosphate cyclase [Thermoproteota archaeon]